MIGELVNLFSGGFLSWALVNLTAEYITKDSLSHKPTDKVYAIKKWKDCSKGKKALYVLLPGAYFGMIGAKSRRHELEEDFRARMEKRAEQKNGYDIAL